MNILQRAQRKTNHLYTKFKRTVIQRGFYSASPATVNAVRKALSDSQNITGNYYEFGLFKGYTFYTAVKNSPSIEHFGFDSFEGLPEVSGIDKGWKFKRGEYSCSFDNVVADLKKRNAFGSKEHLYKGFYNDILTSEFSKNFVKYPARVVLIDCDLYESTVPVLRFIQPMLQEGTIILFDDWNCFEANDNRGERKAVREFLVQNPNIIFEEHDFFGWHGVMFRIHFKT